MYMNPPNDREQYTQYINELRTLITERWLLIPSPIFGSIRIIMCYVLYVAWLFLMPYMGMIFTVLYFYILFIELAYISHDLMHNQYFKNRRINLILTYISGNLLIGLSQSWWIKKHNIGHHNFTNSDRDDTDIRDYDEIFTRNPGRFPLFHKYKKILFWGANFLVYLTLIAQSCRYIFMSKKYWEIALFGLFLLIFPGSLIFHFGFMLGFLVFLSIALLAWWHLALVFMVNHIGMEVIDGDKIREYTWLDLQTRTSRNIRGWVIVDHIFWWLNKQIEHHLFPQASRSHIREISQQVKIFCRERWIRYHEVTFFEALREIYQTLKTGRTI